MADPPGSLPTMPRRLPTHHGPGAPPIAPGLAEMRALAHPLRLTILEAFAPGPRTTKQVAELLGQPPTRLYHHVALLERAGLLRLTGTRKKRGTTEKLYAAVAGTLGEKPRPAAAGKKPREAAARRAVAMTVLEQSRQEVVAAMQRRADRPLLGRLVVSVPPGLSGELKKRLEVTLKAFKREFDCTADAADDAAERWALTLTFAPVSPPRTHR